MSEAIEKELLGRLLDTVARPQRNGLAIAAMTVSALALAIAAGNTAILITRDSGPAAQPPQLATISQSALPVLAAPPPAAAPLPVAVPTFGAPAGAPGEAVRIASADGAIYAFDPTSGLHFRFDPAGGGAIPIPAQEVPEAARATLAVAAPAPAFDTAALDRATAQAREAIGATGEDARRPRVNALLADAKIAGEIVATLDQAVGIFLPASAAPDELTPTIYAFFDPRCPYCHQAFETLDGQHAIMWLPVASLGPGSDPLFPHILGEIGLAAAPAGEGDAGATPTQRAIAAEDPERGMRFRDAMRDRMPPAAQPLTEGQSFALDENMALFRLLYSGQESIAGVPSFLVRKPDGTALFLRGYDAQTPEIIASALRQEG